MEEQISIDDNNDLPATHFFLYKGKQFPFNMSIFRCFSKFFNSYEHQIQENSNINILDEYDKDIIISESSINDFINFCQKNTITLNKENVLSLHILAKKYIVPSLMKSTNKFISNHLKDVAIDLLILNQNDENSNNQAYEEIIISNFDEYFSDSRLLSIPLPALHRIVTKYGQKNLNLEKRSQFIEFLFKCLDHFGRAGSILFEHVDIFSSGSTYLHRLLNEYSEKFDFHFINDQQLKTIYNLESEIIERTRKMNETENSTKAVIDEMMQKQDELKIENDKLKTFLEESSRNKESQIHQFESAMNEFKDQITKLNEIVAQQNNLINQLNEKIVELKKPRISSHFLDESNPRGINSLLSKSVSLSCGGFPGSSCPVTNVILFDDTDFFNNKNAYPNSESQSFIKFDFGESRKIDLYSYFIRSNPNNANTSQQHPKTWRIEGSNDDSHWTLLDRRKDDVHLFGPHKSHHFFCQESQYGNERNRYRYIKYVQEDSWWTNHPYCIWITYFELYGDIFNI